jgi:uncharacterized membrane protein (UPF0127 family)
MRGTILADASEQVDTFLRRGVGLMGRKGLPTGGGLIIRPCNSVVSFFMRFSIDVIFVDRRGTVLYLLRNMVPWRVSKMVRGAKFVVELPSGIIDESRTEVGDVLDIQAV